MDYFHLTACVYSFSFLAYVTVYLYYLCRLFRPKQNSPGRPGGPGMPLGPCTVGPLSPLSPVSPLLHSYTGIIRYLQFFYYKYLLVLICLMTTTSSPRLIAKAMSSYTFRSFYSNKSRRSFKTWQPSCSRVSWEAVLSRRSRWSGESRGTWQPGRARLGPCQACCKLSKLLCDRTGSRL